MKLGPDQKVPLNHCLNCKSKLDAATVVNEDGSRELPADGDATICIYCGHLMAFDAKAKLRPLTDAEMVNVAGDPRIVLVSQAIKKMRDEREAKVGNA